GPRTVAAIEAFQRRVVHLAQPDGRVDPGGRTFAVLNRGAEPPTAATTFRVVFQHQGKTPEGTSSAKGTDALYESKVAVVGGQTWSFRGSVYPDDLAVKGRLKDGSYNLYLGFHRR